MSSNQTENQAAAAKAKQEEEITIGVMLILCCGPFGLVHMWHRSLWRLEVRLGVTVAWVVAATAIWYGPQMPGDSGAAQDQKPHDYLCVQPVGSISYLQIFDNDCDGISNYEDCNPKSSNNKDLRRTDSDCDGILNDLDCAPENAEKPGWAIIDDTDCDGIANVSDCDPKGHTDDLDCDGVTNALDCDPTGHVQDLDCDGVSADIDCNDSISNIRTTKAIDRDCDGIEDIVDCSPDNPAYDAFDCIPAESQRKFCQILQRSTSDTGGNANSVTIATKRYERAASLRKLLPRGSFRGWVGRVTDISTVGLSDKGAVKIDIPCWVTLANWDMESPRNEKYVAVPNSAVYRSIANISKDQEVVFSGNLVPAPTRTDGFLMLETTRTWPHFMINLTEISPAQAAE